VDFRFNPRPPRRTGATLFPLSPEWTPIVSILARPEGRALPTAGSRVHSDRSFNPRPPRRTGATRASCVAPRARPCFNPRPPRRTGATSNAAASSMRSLVSILARPEGRALLLEHPALGIGVPVSILARPEGRALRGWRLAHAGAPPRFNPRPPRRTGATACCAATSRAAMFQSSPAPKDGRYHRGAVRVRRRVSFNPRPPRRTGATF